MSDFAGWIGREQRSADRLDPALAARWCATFDRDAPEAAAMPQGIHFCLCTPEAHTAQLGEDGHPRRGLGRDDTLASFLPPIPLPRRMWAGSAIRFHAPLSVGASVERTSRIASITDKSGSRGPMVFADIAHETAADGVLAVSETQTLVFLDALADDAPLSPPEPTDHVFDSAGWDAHRMATPDPALLFRYSALTFNSHRIHYDAPYARSRERYRGLVVHGPLQASLLLQLAEERFGPDRLASFQFRGLGPAIAGEPLHLVLRGEGADIELAAFAQDGRQVTRASATLA